MKSTNIATIVDPGNLQTGWVRSKMETFSPKDGGYRFQNMIKMPFHLMLTILTKWWWNLAFLSCCCVDAIIYITECSLNIKMEKSDLVGLKMFVLYGNDIVQYIILLWKEMLHNIFSFTLSSWQSKGNVTFFLLP